jgi:4-alpha-glucanotransferase
VSAPARIEEEYRDAFGARRRVPPDVRERIATLLGDEPARDLEPVAVVRPGAALRVPGEVTLEDGTELGFAERLPQDAPFGYHRLRVGGEEQLLLVGPGRCPPPGERRWGWAVQLYATRSAESWGIGDLADLRELAAWSRGLGAGLLVVNPLNAVTPVVPVQPSPYFPSSRRFRDPLYLRVEEVPGAGAVVDLPRLAAAGRALNGGARIDRDAILTLKLDALAAIWAAGPPPRDGLERHRAEIGPALREWATFAVLAERHGAGWSHWPEELRRPGSAAVARFGADHADRVAFHEWVQWLLDEQLRRAADELPLVADVPVGVDRDGADAWAWQDVMALGASIGAPPDRFSVAGQDWGLPPFMPGRLRAAGYEPFVATLRAALRHAAGLRIDHVMGLFRLWWLPLGDDPRNGAYVRYPAEELVEILAIESVRAGAVVIGEDLGTVAPGVRRELRRRNVLSYRLAYFERRPPARYPRASLAAVGTHDLPTIAGAWLGTDPADAAGLALLRARLARAAGVEPTAGVEEVALAAHRALAASPAAIVVATLEDAALGQVRPNMPGTVDQYPNWSIPLSLTVAELARDQFVLRLAFALDRGGARQHV